MIPEYNETWEIQDSSKIQAFMNCPRSYFFRYILGWKQDEKNIHLEYGSAVHLAMEHLLAGSKELPHKVKYTPEGILEAYGIFENYYREHFPPEMDELNQPKTPSNTMTLLMKYVERYQHEDVFDVLYTEVSGCVGIGEGKNVYFKIDAVCDGPDGLFTLEHKTGRGLTRVWADQWFQKTQTGVYTHVLNCMFPDKVVSGVVINGLFPQKPSALKKDGTPRANAKSDDPDKFCARVPVRRNQDQMNDWLFNITFWYDFIRSEIDFLDKVELDANVMTCFPKNTENCTKYFGCPYADYCRAWTNPLRKLDQIPTGFHIEHWDPRNLLDGAKKVVEL